MGRQWQMPKVTFSEAYVSLLKIYKANYIYYCNPSYFQISTNALNTDTHIHTNACTNNDPRSTSPPSNRSHSRTIDHHIDLCCRGGGRVCRDSFSSNGGEHAKHRHRYGHNFLQTSPWRNCLHLSLQFPGDDTPLVVSGLGRLWKRHYSQTIGTRARRLDDPRRSVHQGRRATRIVERYTRPTRGCRFHLRASWHQSSLVRRFRSSGTCFVFLLFFFPFFSLLSFISRRRESINLLDG